jgi:hypothetical protein
VTGSSLAFEEREYFEPAQASLSEARRPHDSPGALGGGRPIGLAGRYQ